MTSWMEIVVIGATVGLVSFFGPLVLDYVRMMRFVRYINMDMIRFLQLLETGGADALAYPLSQKLSEKGALLSWKTQRRLTSLRDTCLRMGSPLEADIYTNLMGSLEMYRGTVDMFSGRSGVMGWRACTEFIGPVPNVIRRTFKAIDRDWEEFRRQSAFLQAFLKRHTDVKTGSAS